MKKALTSVLLMFLTTTFSPTLKAQNLVGNSGFEDTIACPTGNSQPYNSAGWSSYRESPDYFNACATPASTVSVPYNMLGHQVPHSGDAYMGAQAWRTNLFYREYFGHQLSSPLNIGTRYFVSFYVNCAYSVWDGTCLATNKLGALFSTIPYSSSSPAPVNNFAHVYTNTIITDTINWVLIKSSFIADSSYRYVCFGNFFDNAHTDTTQLIPTCDLAYYYFDDVCVTTDSNGCSLEDNLKAILPEKESVFPNPAHDLINISGIKLQLVELIDVLGKIGFRQETVDAINTTIHVGDLHRGLYIMKISTLNKYILTKIILN